MPQTPTPTCIHRLRTSLRLRTGKRCVRGSQASDRGARGFEAGARGSNCGVRRFELGAEVSGISCVRRVKTQIAMLKRRLSSATKRHSPVPSRGHSGASYALEAAIRFAMLTVPDLADCSTPAHICDFRSAQRDAFLIDSSIWWIWRRKRRHSSQTAFGKDEILRQSGFKHRCELAGGSPLLEVG
jgi:hypothetical protein